MCTSGVQGWFKDADRGACSCAESLPCRCAWGGVCDERDSVRERCRELCLQKKSTVRGRQCVQAETKSAGAAAYRPSEALLHEHRAVG